MDLRRLHAFAHQQAHTPFYVLHEQHAGVFDARLVLLILLEVHLFKNEPLTLAELAFCLAMSSVVLVGVEIEK